MANNYTKHYRSINQQLEILKKRGLLISDEDKAKHYLKTVGYYRLSGYWFPFRQRNDDDTTIIKDDFIQGVEFDHVIKLYVFDRKLRLLFMEAIERLEVALRVEIALLMGRRDAWVHRKANFLDYKFTKKKSKNGKTGHQNWLDRLDAHIKTLKRAFC